MEVSDPTSVTLINPTYFPGKLWHLVNDPQIHSIWWDASGEGILVHQQSFEAEVLSSQTRQVTENFRTMDFHSFVRQLNLYGFRKERSGRDISEKQTNISPINAQLHRFYNPSFKRDKPELLLNIQRRTPVNKAKLAGIKVTSQMPKLFHHEMLNSTQESSSLMKTGSTLLGHQGTHYHHPRNGLQQEKRSNTPQHGFYTPAGMEVRDPTSVTLINPTYFPGKLWHLVNDPQIHSIWWDASGEGILVHQQSFEAEVLSSQTRQVTENFRTMDFHSFVRQLNLYGFRKERSGRDISEKQTNISPINAQLHRFYNPSFKRDKPELLLNIQRRTPVNKAKLAGIKVTCQMPKLFHHEMLNSTQESSSLMKTVYQRCSPDVLDSTLPSFQEPAASYSPSGYYPDYSVGYAHLIDQDPFWNAGDVPESRTSDPEKEEEELDAILNLVSEMQDYSVGYAHLIDQDPFWNAADVPESRTSDRRKRKRNWTLY